MYGQIHVCVRALVLEKFGKEAWMKILAKAECDDATDFMVFHHYDDSVTMKMVAAASEVLGVPVDDILDVFGEFFLRYCLEHGYDNMLRTLGHDFFTFIQNLDSLHVLVSMTYTDIVPPSFRCEAGPDDTLILHYYSTRKGLHYLVKGVIRAVARDIFNTQVTSEILDITMEELGENRVQQHTTFKLTCAAMDATEDTTAQRSTVVTKVHNEMSKDPMISCQSFCSIFPFHIIFDSELNIKQSGANIHRMSKVEVSSTAKLDQLFELLHPPMPLTCANIKSFINAGYIMAMKDPRHNTKIGPTVEEKQKRLCLKGQMILLADTDHLIFVGSPRLSSLTELKERNLYLSDIPLHDVTRELVLMNQQRIAEIEISKKLDRTTAELKITAQALEEEKKRTDTLLYQMLPVKVANQLRDGIKVEAEKFKESTVLFSDIVTFTNIAAAVQPMDIVHMLNALYSRFDDLTSIHGVYKVETIGDAYMVVGGVPEVSTEHAHLVAGFALGMIERSREVKSPATDKPLQIRVGMHTGPVVAGVVGDKMPRYCLFGDTVNTASRMESHGLPGRIHCSPTTYSALSSSNFILEKRGELEVKGKGLMVTYFLIGQGDHVIGSPDQDVTEAGNGVKSKDSPEHRKGSVCCVSLSGDKTVTNNGGKHNTDEVSIVTTEKQLRKSSGVDPKGRKYIPLSLPPALKIKIPASRVNGHSATAGIEEEDLGYSGDESLVLD